MKRALGAALGMLVWGLGCAPRGGLPWDVLLLRQQLPRKAIVVPLWTHEVAEALAAQGAQYAGKTFLVEGAHLDPRGELHLGKDLCRFPLAGGGSVAVPAAGVPLGLRAWTGAPVKFRGVLHPPRPAAEGQPPGGPLLRAESIDFARPLELAHIRIERMPEATWLVVQVENYRGEPARATVEVRFDSLHERRKLGPLESGGVASVRLRLFGPTAPQWAGLPRERRALRLSFDDGSSTEVDIGKWLEGPPASLLDLGYTFSPPGTAALALSTDSPEAELERLAALELRSYLEQFAGANIEPREPDSSEPLPLGPLLVVGTARHNKLAAELLGKAGLEDRVKKLGEDGFVLKSLRHGDRPALLVGAATPRGIVNGTYALLERYGVQFSLFGVRLPTRRPFRLLELDESNAPLFARRSLVAAGPERGSTARWSQWQWLTMIDLAAKNRFNEVVFPLEGLEATFAYEPGRSSGAMFPFEVTPPYTCVAEAYLAHQRGLAILADYARRRGVLLSFAREGPEGRLLRAAAPACLPPEHAQSDVGQAIEVMADPGDFLALPRVEEMAKAAASLLGAKAASFAVPYRRGARARGTFIARFAWDPALTPAAHFRRYAGTLCEGEAADKLAGAMLEIDRLDGDVLAAAPRPFGLGAPLAFPAQEGDLGCDWAALRARAASPSAAAEVAVLREQCQKLRELQARLEPIQVAFREALGSLPPPWEAPLFEAAPAERRSERVSENLYMFRALLGVLASVQEGALAYYAALAEPAEALPQLALASTKWRKARRILAWVQSRAGEAETVPALAATGERLRQGVEHLAEWLGPAADAEPEARLTLKDSDAVVHLFRTRNEDVFAAYKLAGSETVQIRLNAHEVRLYRRGQGPRTLRSESGLFLLSLDSVPTYLVTRHAAWPGLQAP